MPNYDVIHKAEVAYISYGNAPDAQAAATDRAYYTHKTLLKIGCVVSEIFSRTDTKQTRSSQYSATPPLEQSNNVLAGRCDLLILRIAMCYRTLSRRVFTSTPKQLPPSPLPLFTPSSTTATLFITTCPSLRSPGSNRSRTLSHVLLSRFTAKTATEKRASEKKRQRKKWLPENWAIGKIGNEK